MAPRVDFFLKLNQYGISNDLLAFLTNYLSNRKQSVVLNDSISSSLPLTAGVLQGSVLGPLLFLIYVNDISEHLLSLTRLFADDSSLFVSATNINSTPVKQKLFYFLILAASSFQILFLMASM